MSRYAKLITSYVTCDGCRDRRARVFVQLSPFAMYVDLCEPCVRSLAARYGDAAKLLRKGTRGKR